MGNCLKVKDTIENQPLIMSSAASENYESISEETDCMVRSQSSLSYSSSPTLPSTPPSSPLHTFSENEYKMSIPVRKKTFT